jgi:thioredoxin 1
MMSQVHDVDDASFETEVVKADGTVLVDFSATWCGPCKKLEPVVDEIAGDYDGRVKVVRVDVDKAPGTAAKFAVMSVPTLIFFRDGQVRDQVIGLVPKRAIAERIDKVL